MNLTRAVIVVMDKTYTVYMHVSPSNKVYVGMTKRNPVKRWGYNGYCYKNNDHFSRAIKKYGWDNFQHLILFSNLTPVAKYVTISIPNSGGENFISKTGNIRHIQLRIIGTTITALGSLTIGSIADSSDYPVRNVVCQGLALDGNGYPIHNMVFNIGADGTISCVNGNAIAYGFILNICYIR